MGASFPQGDERHAPVRACPCTDVPGAWSNMGAPPWWKTASSSLFGCLTEGRITEYTNKDGKRDQKKQVPLTVKEFFSGFKSNADPGSTSRVGMRVAIGLVLTALVVITIFLGLVIAHDRSALQHRCEQNYILWPMAIANLCVYATLVISFCCITNEYTARAQGWCACMLLFAMVGWFVIVTIRMAHICITFYSIKYPMLLSMGTCCFVFNCFLLILLTVRECYQVLYQEEEDETIITHVLYKQDEKWVPSLFDKERIQTYQKGVNTWGDALKDRNKTLKMTLQTAEKIHDQSTSQSQLLTQVTSLVKETGSKVNKAFTLIKEQELLIGNMNDVVDDAVNRLDEMKARNTDISIGMTWGDRFRWALIAFMCCGIVGGCVVAVPKWMHLMGITLNIQI